MGAKMKSWKCLGPKLCCAILFCVGNTLFATGIGETQEQQNTEISILPLTKVVLFSTGIGYYLRTGVVDENRNVELYFHPKDVNDLLKSMILQDYDGGLISSVNYSSRDPVNVRLRSLSIDLTANPGIATLLGQARGESIVAVLTGGNNRISGTIIGVENKPNNRGVSAPHLNLFIKGKIKSIPIEDIDTLQFTDLTLARELTKALDLLAESNRREKKRITIRFEGEGLRRVLVGYLLESPVWKTTYRLVVGEDNKHDIQGWAIVENTTEDDWHDVRLNLVSGQPVSFTMDLYRPIFLPRPSLEPELYASAQPQQYEERKRERASSGFAAPEMAMAAPQAMDSFSGLAAEKEGGYYEDDLDLGQGVQSGATAERSGEFFLYIIKEPVTIPRKESAMVPIVSEPIEGEKLSIFNQRNHPNRPYNALMLKNTTQLDLMGGPLTVFEAGSYAGDSLITSMPAGSTQLISYSLDLSTDIAFSSKTVPDKLISVRAKKGILTTETLRRRDNLYSIWSRGLQNRILLLEHPILSGWDLVDTQEPDEQTRSYYRFRIPLGASGEHETPFPVSLESTVKTNIPLQSASDSTIAFYIDSVVVSTGLKSSLRGILDRRQALNETTRQRQSAEQQRSGIYREQARIRGNLENLEKDSPLYDRYVEMLDEQENQLLDLSAKIESFMLSEREQKDAMQTYIQSIQTD